VDIIRWFTQLPHRRRSIVFARTPNVGFKSKDLHPSTAATNQWFNWEAAVWDAGTCRYRFRDRWDYSFRPLHDRTTNSAPSTPLLSRYLQAAPLVWWCFGWNRDGGFAFPSTPL